MKDWKDILYDKIKKDKTELFETLAEATRPKTIEDILSTIDKTNNKKQNETNN